jgi:hypothetical protein
MIIIKKISLTMAGLWQMKLMGGTMNETEEIIELEILSQVGGKKIISIEEKVRTAEDFPPLLGIEVEIDDAIDVSVDENIEEIRRQMVMNAL